MEAIKILAVDDEPFNLDLIELAFFDAPFGVELTKAVNGKEALEKVPQCTPDVILLDLRMPVMDGIQALEKLKSDPNFENIPVIVVTANSEEKYKALKMGANDFLSKPVDVEELKLRTFNQANYFKIQKQVEELNRNLEGLVTQRTLELSKALIHAKETEYEISLRLGRASEYRDLETGMHIKRMSHYSALLGKLFGISSEEEQLLLYASPLHDIGKIGIPDSILLKPGRLNEAEFKVMKEHTTIGGLMLEEGEKYPIISIGKIIALQHHEKFDGSGYPKGLQGEEIHIYARIVAIADVFDALSSKRVYKDPFPLDKTIQIIKEGRGTHFDPVLIDLFLENIDQFLEIKTAFPDKDEIPHLLNIIEECR